MKPGRYQARNSTGSPEGPGRAIKRNSTGSFNSFRPSPHLDRRWIQLSLDQPGRYQARNSTGSPEGPGRAIKRNSTGSFTSLNSLQPVLQLSFIRPVEFPVHLSRMNSAPVSEDTCLLFQFVDDPSAGSPTETLLRLLLPLDMLVR